MTTRKCNYNKFIKWYQGRADIRNLRRLSILTGFSNQRLDYAIRHGSFMKEEVIKKITQTFNLTEKQVKDFFYTYELSN